MKLGAATEAVKDINALTREFEANNTAVLDKAKKLWAMLPAATSEPTQWEDKADGIIKQALNAISGQAVTEPEYQRILRLRPSRGSSTAGGLVKLQALKNIFQNMAGGGAKVLSESGYRIPNDVLITMVEEEVARLEDSK